MNEATIKVSHAMQGIAQALNESLEHIAGAPMGFALLVFTDGRASYVSNCDRAEMVREMKTLLAHWEAGLPDVPAHEVQG